jgi:hypothetical protein
VYNESVFAGGRRGGHFFGATGVPAGRDRFPENPGEESHSPFTRLDWVSRDRVDIQWQTPTGKWFRLYRNLSLAEA